VRKLSGNQRSPRTAAIASLKFGAPRAACASKRCRCQRAPSGSERPGRTMIPIPSGVRVCVETAHQRQVTASSGPAERVLFNLMD
jgi:hypothetical protein